MVSSSDLLNGFVNDCYAQLNAALLQAYLPYSVPSLYDLMASPGFMNDVALGRHAEYRQRNFAYHQGDEGRGGSFSMGATTAYGPRAALLGRGRRCLQ